MNNLDPKPRVGFARDLARKILKKANINKPPVDLNLILPVLRDLYKINISAHAWNLGEKVSGIHVVCDDAHDIAYNKEQHRHRQRFTIAHEIGHLLMEHAEDRTFDLESEACEEIEANQFASELLIPLKMLKADIADGIRTFKDLAKRYDVSQEAMGWKIKGCNLISRL